DDNTRRTTNDPPLTGADVGRITRSTGYQPVSSFPQILVACDVTSPLYGPNGAARIFAPQKGAKPEPGDPFDRPLRQLGAIRPTRNPRPPPTPGVRCAPPTSPNHPISAVHLTRCTSSCQWRPPPPLPPPRRPRRWPIFSSGSAASPPRESACHRPRAPPPKRT